MVATEWYGGIPAKANAWQGASFVAESDKDNYFLSFFIQSDAFANINEFHIYGVPDKNTYPLYVEGFFHPAFSALAQFSNNVVTKIKQNTIVFPVVKAVAIDNWTIAYGTFVRLGVTVGNFTDQEIMGKVMNGARVTKSVQFKAPDVLEWVGEYQIAPTTTPIVQPVHRGGFLQGSVATEFNVVSDHASDTIAGTGMQKGRVVYYKPALDVKVIGEEFDMNGITPVELKVAHNYDDVLVVHSVIATQVGTALHNVGNIVIQNNA